MIVSMLGQNSTKAFSTSSPDIEKAFLMIFIAEADRDVLRFLWINDIGQNSPEIVVMRFARIVFGVLSSPFLLNATICHHLKRSGDDHPEFVQMFRSTYADDISFGAESDDGAFEVFENSKKLLSSRGFNL